MISRYVRFASVLFENALKIRLIATYLLFSIRRGALAYRIPFVIYMKDGHTSQIMPYNPRPIRCVIL
jgi:hypothetical protein